MIITALFLLFLLGTPAAQATCLTPIHEPMREQMRAIAPDLASLASQFRHVVQAIDRHIGSSEMTLSTLQHPLVRERLGLPSRSERASVRLSDLNVSQLHQFAQLLPRFSNIDADLRGHIQLYVHYRQLYSIASQGVRNMESALTESEPAAALRRFQFAAGQWASLGSADLVPSWLAHFDRHRLFRPFANENWSMQSIQQTTERIYQRIGSTPFTQAYEQAESLCSCSRPSSRPLTAAQHITVQIAEDAASAIAASAPAEPTPRPATTREAPTRRPSPQPRSARDAEIRRLRAEQERRQEALRQQQLREERRLNARASVPTRAQLIQQGEEVMNRALRENQGNLPRDFSSLRYRAHAEVRIPDSPHRRLTQGEYETITLRHDRAIASTVRAAQAQSDPELRVAAIRQSLHNEFGRAYADNTASVIAGLQSDDGNCQFLNDLYLDYFSRNPEHVPPGWRLALQDFGDHVQTVFIPNDLTDRRVWVLSTSSSDRPAGTIEPLARAPVYTPALALRGTLRDFGRALRRPPDSAFRLRGADVPPASPEALARAAQNSRRRPVLLSRSYSDEGRYLYSPDGSPPPERATLPMITTLERPHAATLEDLSRSPARAEARPVAPPAPPGNHPFGSREYRATLTHEDTRFLVSLLRADSERPSANRTPTDASPTFLKEQLEEILRNRRDLRGREVLETLAQRVETWAQQTLENPQRPAENALSARYQMIGDLCHAARGLSTPCRNLSPWLRNQIDELNARIDRWAAHPEQIVDEMNQSRERRAQRAETTAPQRARIWQAHMAAYGPAYNAAIDAGMDETAAMVAAEAAGQKAQERVRDQIHGRIGVEVHYSTLVEAHVYAVYAHPEVVGLRPFDPNSPVTRIFDYLVNPENVGRDASPVEVASNPSPSAQTRAAASGISTSTSARVDPEVLEASALYSLPTQTLASILRHRISRSSLFPGEQEKAYLRTLLQRSLSIRQLGAGHAQAVTVCGDLVIDPTLLHDLATLAARIDPNSPEILCPSHTHPTRTPSEEYAYFRELAAAQ